MLETTTEEAPAWADVKESYDYLLHFALLCARRLGWQQRYHLRCLMVRPPHKVSLQQLADARYSLLTR